MNRYIKLRTVVVYFFLLISLYSVSICQDSTRTGLKGLSIGVNWGNPFSIGNVGFYGKYWLNDQFVPLAGVSFSSYESIITYSNTGLPTNTRSTVANCNLLAGFEYHLLKNQQFSGFTRFTVGSYISNVPGFNSGNIFDSGVILLNAGFGVEWFIIPHISVSVRQDISLSYVWGNKVYAPNQPPIPADVRTFSINNAN